VVAVLIADGQQAELGEAAVGVNHQVVDNGLELAPDAGDGVAAIVEGRVAEARVGGEELEILAWADKNDFGFWETLLRGIHEHTGDGDIRAERDAREHKHAARLDGHGARTAHASVTGGVGAGNRLREEARVDVAQGGLEAVAQTLGQNAE